MKLFSTQMSACEMSKMSFYKTIAEHSNFPNPPECPFPKVKDDLFLSTKMKSPIDFFSTIGQLQGQRFTHRRVILSKSFAAGWKHYHYWNNQWWCCRCWIQNSIEYKNVKCICSNNKKDIYEMEINRNLV